MHDQRTDHDWLSPPHAAAILGVSIQTAARWRCEGFGPRWARSGRLVRYRRSDIEAWLESRVVGSTSEAAVRGLASRRTSKRRPLPGETTT